MISPDLSARIKAFAAAADPDTVRETCVALADAAALPDADGAMALNDAFSVDLDFGTGGLRGLMGPGSNRMNRLTVGRATQGLAEYVKQQAGGAGSVVIAHDSRHRSAEFAREAARVVAANGLKAYLFADLRPTPLLSFAVRHLHCTAGVVVTASHNPKEYNGYKVSWDDGGQVLPPHDRAIIAKVRAVAGGAGVAAGDFDALAAAGRIVTVGPEVEEAYLRALDHLRFNAELADERGSDLKIVYTSLHGTGITLVPAALTRWGFKSVSIVKAQETPDGDFPTAKSPNPEEAAALALAIAQADAEQADLVLATDPDADRLGIAVRHGGAMRLMTGNQVGALLADYVSGTLEDQGRLPGNAVIIKTIVTTGLIARIAESRDVALENCLTGFKYIAQIMRQYEDIIGESSLMMRGSHATGPSKTFLMGCEESYGYLVGTHARDKDAVVAACVVAEMALKAKADGLTLIDLLRRLHARHGVHIESQASVSMPGLTGMKAIEALMESLRADPPRDLAGVAMAAVTDIRDDSRVDVATGAKGKGPGLPASNVLMFDLADGSLVVARPSGTEPKVKFYFLVVDREGFPLDEGDTATLDAKTAACEAKDAALREAFKALAAERTKAVRQGVPPLA